MARLDVIILVLAFAGVAPRPAIFANGGRLLEPSNRTGKMGRKLVRIAELRWITLGLTADIEQAFRPLSPHGGVVRAA
jgi:hypothetical protein